MNEDGEPEGPWRIRREEVGGKDQEGRGDSKRQPKRTQNRLFKYLNTYVELCAWATEDVILHLRLANLQKRNKKLTDENPVNEGLTDEFRMIPSVF